MAPKGAEGRHDREEQFGHVRLCREAFTSDGRMNGKLSAGDETINDAWIAGQARNDASGCRRRNQDGAAVTCCCVFIENGSANRVDRVCAAQGHACAAEPGAGEARAMDLGLLLQQ